eukprot:CAMPEP_0170192788 /NCGR_PEP_ID=MMETSP0040_2-20121228/55199_1 /TAXON_ID=641309 /ORGANISM="Lotharella oceanica, Strain CCMP622" /LENGTH=284 /DNA_ID=CAMNT_0010441241 /DNA_START=1 /DNA_END=855 /DNA_ORIENTATION=+
MKFRLPPTKVKDGYKSGDIVEATGSIFGKEWQKCVIIDIVADKFVVVFLHNGVRRTKYSAEIRPAVPEDEDDDSWDAEVALFGDEKKDEKKKKSSKKRRKKKSAGEPSAVNVLLRAAIGKEAKADCLEMSDKYAKVSQACSDEITRDEVAAYIETKLSNHKYPMRVLKALLLSSYLLAYGDIETATLLVEKCALSITEATKLQKTAKTAAGKRAVLGIEQIKPLILPLIQNPSALSRLRETKKKKKHSSVLVMSLQSRNRRSPSAGSLSTEEDDGTSSRRSVKL